MSAGNHASEEVMWIGGPAPDARSPMCFQTAVQPEFWDELQYVQLMDAPELMPAGSCLKAVAYSTAWATQRRAVR